MAAAGSGVGRAVAAAGRAAAVSGAAIAEAAAAQAAAAPREAGRPMRANDLATEDARSGSPRRLPRPSATRQERSWSSSRRGAAIMPSCRSPGQQSSRWQCRRCSTRSSGWPGHHLFHRRHDLRDAGVDIGAVAGQAGGDAEILASQACAPLRREQFLAQELHTTQGRPAS